MPRYPVSPGRGELRDGLFSGIELDDYNTDRLPGTRLERVEVWNWGTFSGRVWALDVGGRNALLTGRTGGRPQRERLIASMRAWRK
ncbi:MAG TPA: ATP-binding protein [Mycobacterium sp.]|nr:ATP-binding protein [Mycobacterium sp.]